MRILVAGGPRVGKTTLAAELAQKHGILPQHTDDLIRSHSWSDASLAVAGWFAQERFVVEGVAVVRALRKWLNVFPEGKPADVLFLGTTARVRLTEGQETMAIGHATIWHGIEWVLRHRGVEIVRFGPRIAANA